MKVLFRTKSGSYFCANTLIALFKSSLPTKVPWRRERRGGQGEVGRREKRVRKGERKSHEGGKGTKGAEEREERTLKSRYVCNPRAVYAI